MEGSYIDLILASRPNLHKHSQVFESEINEHHLMISTTLKSAYTQLKPKVLRKRQNKKNLF